MTPREFEYFVSDYYKQQGYKTIITPYSGDWGIDVIAFKGEREISYSSEDVWRLIQKNYTTGDDAIIWCYGI